MTMDEPVDFQSFIHSYSSGLLEVHATSATPVTRVYLISHPVPGNISAIKISIVSHDQGTTSPDAEISNTWFDATILRPTGSAGDKGKSKLPSAPIVTDRMGCSEPSDLWWVFKHQSWLLVDSVRGGGVFRVCANSISSEWQTHEVLWNAGAHSDTNENSDTSLIDMLKEGDRIAIWARAKGLNWRNFVQHMRIEMTLTESRRIGFREWLPHRYDPKRVPDLVEDETFFGSIGTLINGDSTDKEVFEKHEFLWSIEEYKTWPQHHVGGKGRRELHPESDRKLDSDVLAHRISAEPSDPCESCGLQLSHQFFTCKNCQKRVCTSCQEVGKMDNHHLIHRMIFNQNVENFVEDGGGGVEDATSTTARRLRNEHYADYKPLDKNTREIRLLTIMPSEDDEEPLSCVLIHKAISESHYVALSYCWGDLGKQKGITVAHASYVSENTNPIGPFHPLRVTENLFNALKSIRGTLRILGESSFTTKFWIDALCINQGDNAERAQQVGLMDQIYANADTVWVWIGDSEDTQSAMRSIDRFGREAHQVFERCTRSRSISTMAFLRFDPRYDRRSNLNVLETIFPRLDKDENSQKDGARFMCAVVHVMGQPWFERIWVLQEVFCAKRSVYVHTGLNHLVKFDNVLLGNHYLTFLAPLSDTVREAAWSRIPQAWRDLTRGLHQRRSKKSADGGTMTLIKVFRHTFHSFKATDPRDKLFGLLSLAGEKSQLASPSYLNVPKTPIVDYTKPTSEVFCDFTLWCIKNYRNLDVLSVVAETNCHFLLSYHSLTSAQEYDKDLPSWALWHSGKPSELRGNLALESQPFDVSGKRDVDTAALQSNGRPTLTLKGVRIGIVKSVSFGVLGTTNINENSNSLSKELRAFNYRTHGYRWFPMHTLWAVARSDTLEQEGTPTHHWLGHAQSAYQGDEEAMFRDLLETIMLRVPDPSSGNIWEAEDIAHKLALYWKRHDPELREVPPSVRDFMEPLLTKSPTWDRIDGFISLVPIPGKALFMSDEWRLGLCPPETEVGDVIVVLFGGKVPFILRPKQSVPLPDQPDGQEWVFVGECFVHGRMHSGVVDEKLRQNVPIENFHLV